MAKNEVWCEKPGVYYDIPYSEYEQIPALRASDLVWGLKSGRHLEAALSGAFKQSDSSDKLFGRAIHARLLEPEVYKEQYIIGKTCESRLGSGKRKGQQCGCTATFTYQNNFFCGKHVHQLCQPLVDHITEDQAYRIGRIVEAVKEHNVVHMLRSKGGYEATVLFEKQGFPCKARLDKLIESENLVLDLKKVQSGECTDEACERACWKWHYDFKAAWYVDALDGLLQVPHKFVWLYVEDDGAFDINVIQMDAETHAIGRIRYEEAFNTFVFGVRDGIWEGSTREVKMGGLSQGKKEWFLKR